MRQTVRGTGHSKMVKLKWKYQFKKSNPTLRDCEKYEQKGKITEL